ncbi:hypothetical protein ABZ297_31530 [Nonomuraea sp. NPDC005983]|uniref:hypothetical protein n=1 Tax=Nonomuraea sp. NPDC005983 TaxID=3155595 RepID=UPI0033BB2FB8
MLVCYDLLYDDGRSLVGQPYTVRRAALESLGLSSARWQTAPSWPGGGRAGPAGGPRLLRWRPDRPRCARPLPDLAARLGDDFVAGIVLHTGAQTLPFGDRMRAMPVGALWEIG